METITLSAEVEYLTPEQAAEFADMSRSSFLAHVKAGGILPDKKIGSRSFFTKTALHKWLIERRKNGAKKRGPKPQRRRQ